MKQKRDLRNLKPIRTCLVSKKPCDTKDLPDCPRSVTPLIPITRGLKESISSLVKGFLDVVTPLIPITRGLKAILEC